MKNITIKKLYYILFVIYSLFCYSIVKDYGITGDEQVQVKYGHYVWDYMKHFGHPAVPFDSVFDKNMSDMKYYGGIYDGTFAMIVDTFHISDEYQARHYFNLLFGLLAILFTGLCVKALTGSYYGALLGSMVIGCIPRFFGEMFNNPKDIPFAAGYIMTIYFMIQIFKHFDHPKIKYYIGLALSIGLSVGVRAGGLLVIGYFVLFFCLYWYINRKLIQNAFKINLKYSLCFVITGYLLACIWWPFAHQNLLINPVLSVVKFSNFEAGVYMLFEGKRINCLQVPPGYLIKWLIISTPLFVFLGLILSFFSARQNRFYLLLLYFSLIFPIAYIIYKKSIVYDGIRHILFVLPVMAVLASLGFYYVIAKLRSKNLKIGAGVLLFILMLLPIKHMIANHPNEYIYFNEIFGGAENAFGYYELDYYHNSGKKTTDWIKSNILPNAKGKIKILTNMGPVPLYFKITDTDRVTANYGRWRERDHLDWDYYIAYSRFIEPENLQNGAWPPGEVVYAVRVDNVPVAVVMKRKTKLDIPAYEALMKNDFPTAAAEYDEALKIDPSNEYSWYYYGIALAQSNRAQEAIAAIKKATDLNSSNPDWYGILAKLYQSVNDNQNANMAAMKQQELINELDNANE